MSMGWEAESEDIPLTPEKEAELRRVATENAATTLNDLELAQSEIDRFHALTDASRAAVHVGKHEAATELANELLELAPLYKTDWNYGNAIHHAHTALGLVALANGDITKAIGHLLASGETPGSPQLDTFGPSMELARALMRAGQFEPMEKYLSSCRVFWKMGGNWLDVWGDKVSRKIVPNCFMHAYL